MANPAVDSTYPATFQRRQGGDVVVPSGVTLDIEAGGVFSIAGKDRTVALNTVEISVPLTASTASQTVWIADGTYQVSAAQVIPNVIGGAGATVTVEWSTGTTAVGSGTAQLTAPVALNGVANTVLSGTVIASPTTTAAGDRIGIVMAGTLTGLVGVLTLVVKRV